MKFYRALFSLVFVVCFLAATGCNHDIAENHVAVLSVTRWDDYKSELQPQFTLSADQAFSAALPDTLQLQQGLTHQFQAALQLKLAPSVALPAGFGSGQSGASTTQPSAGSTLPPTSQPYGVVGATPLGSDAFLQYQAATALFQEVKLLDRYVRDAAIPSDCRAYVVRLSISTMPQQRGLAYDAFLDLGMFFDRFEQPVEANDTQLLLETWNIQAAINQLKLQMETATSKPSTTKPSTKGSKSAGRGNAAEILELLQDLASIKADYVAQAHSDPVAARCVAIDRLDALQQKAEKAESATSSGLGPLVAQMRDELNKPLKVKKPYYETPKIIPLLVTDEIEAALAARRADDLQQLAFSLSAAYAGIGGSISASNLDAAMRNAVGRDYNNLFSVARVNDNTVRVRIGARQTSAMPKETRVAARSAESYELVTQNHCVSLLVLVPRSFVETDPQAAYFGTHTSFVRIKDGKKVTGKEIKRNEVESALEEKYKDDYLHLGANSILLAEPCDLQKLLYNAAAAAQNSQYEKFLGILGAKSGALDMGAVNRMWMEMTEDRIASSFDSGSFELPAYPARSTLLAQTVFLQDDGKQTQGIITGNLEGVDNRTVKVAWQGLKIGRTRLDDVMATTSLGDTGLAVAFPSLKGTKVSSAGSTIVFTGGDGIDHPENVVYVLADKATAGKGSMGKFTVSPNEIALLAGSKGSAILTLEYSKEYGDFLKTDDFTKNPTDFPLLVVKGQAVVDGQVALQSTMVPDSKVLNAYRIKLNKSGTVTINLASLVKNRDVIFSISGPKDWEAPQDVVAVVAK